MATVFLFKCRYEKETILIYKKGSFSTVKENIISYFWHIFYTMTWTLQLKSALTVLKFNSKLFVVIFLAWYEYQGKKRAKTWNGSPWSIFYTCPQNIHRIPGKFSLSPKAYIVSDVITSFYVQFCKLLSLSVPFLYLV